MNGRQMLINLVVVVVLLLIGGGIFYEVYESNNYVYTDNASVTVPSVTLDALSAGQVATIPVQVGQTVTAGETLVDLAAPAGATGSAAAAAQSAVVRPVASRHGTTGTHTAAAGSGAASAASANAGAGTGATAAAAAGAGPTRITSPVNGVVTAISATPGETVFPGQELVTLTEPQQADVVANVPETSIRNVKVGQSVNVTIDAYPGTTFSGTVAAIQPATQASLSLFPASALSGTFTKVTQLVPVIIDIDTQGYTMYNGLSAEIRIQTGSGNL